MKKPLLLIIALVVTMSLLFGAFGCAQPAPIPEAKIRLRWNDWGPQRAMTIIQEWFLDEVEKRSEGRVTFDRYYSGALSGGKDMPDNLKAGTFDIGPIYGGYDIAKLPLCERFDNTLWRINDNGGTAVDLRGIFGFCDQTANNFGFQVRKLDEMLLHSVDNLRCFLNIPGSALDGDLVVASYDFNVALGPYHSQMLIAFAEQIKPTGIRF